MPVTHQTASGAPSMRFCNRLVAGQEAIAQLVQHVRDVITSSLRRRAAAFWSLSSPRQPHKRQTYRISSRPSSRPIFFYAKIYSKSVGTFRRAVAYGYISVLTGGHSDTSPWHGCQKQSIATLWQYYCLSLQSRRRRGRHSRQFGCLLRAICYSAGRQQTAAALWALEKIFWQYGGPAALAECEILGWE